MDSLPTETLLHIISFLDKASIVSLERVCPRLSSVITRHIWALELLQLAKDHPDLAHKFSKHGIGYDLVEKMQSCTIEEQDSLLEKVRHLYKTVAGIEQRWKDCDPPPPTTHHLNSSGEEYIVNFEFYQDKVFVAYQSEKLEAFSTSGDFSKIKVLRYEDGCHMEVEDCPFAMSGNTIVHRNWTTNQMELWNADTHEKIGKLCVPTDQTDTWCHPITGLGINRKAIVGLVDPCNIYVWPHDFSPGFEDCAPLVIRGPEVLMEDELDPPCSVVHMNEAYLVTALIDDNYGQQIHQHRFDVGEALLSKEFVSITPVNEVELNSLCLSKDKLLAFKQYEWCSVMLHIKDVTNNVSIFKGPMPGLWSSSSDYDLPVAWVNQTFFFETRIVWELRDEKPDFTRPYMGFEGKLRYLDVREQKFGTIPIAFRANKKRNQITVEKTRICYAAKVADMTEQHGIVFNVGDLEIYDFWNACESLTDNPKEEKETKWKGRLRSRHGRKRSWPKNKCAL